MAQCVIGCGGGCGTVCNWIWGWLLHNVVVAVAQCGSGCITMWGGLWHNVGVAVDGTGWHIEALCQSLKTGNSLFFYQTLGGGTTPKPYYFRFFPGDFLML